MANFGNCIDWVLEFEDRGLRGVVVDLGDGGGRTRFGIAEKFNPEATDFFYKANPAVALEIAKNIYWRNYWLPICGASLTSDELAATLLSFAVNDGIAQAVKELQAAFGAALVCDGHLGSKTLAAIARGNSSDIACKLREAQEEFYRRLAVLTPGDARFLDDWVTRARAVYPDLPN